jgi:DNA primase
MIPKSFVQELLGRADIVDVIESYLPLKRAGTNLVACCPFHNEKTPSFTVSPSKQFYHCFGCGAHGSAIGFLMEYSGAGYVEAIKDLASRVGMQVPEITRVVDGARAGEIGGSADVEQLTEVLQRAAQFYKAELKRSERAIAYLKFRGLTGDVAGRFHLGYAPAGWQNLTAAFDNYQARSLVEAGLVIEGDDGKRYDRFRDRIMFPIVSQRGQVIGFGGRVLDHGEPKYLNSPETPVFEKGRELYGLPQARRAIRDAGRILVVEGYMDVVALAQFEIGYVCAALGTATTPWHVQKLLRQTDEVVFCFDGDAAGRKAAWRALENSVAQLQDGKQIKFLFLPEQDDPDSFIRREGKAVFERLVDAATPLSEFALNHLTAPVDMASAEGRAKFLQDAKPLVKQISAPIFALMMRKRIAELAGVTQTELEQRLELKAPRRGNENPARVVRMGSDPYAKLLERVLAEPILIQELRLVSPPVPASPSAEASALFDLLEESTGLEHVPTFAAAIELLRGRGHEATLQKIMKDVEDLQRLSTEELRGEVQDGIRKLLAGAIEARRERAAAGVSSPDELSAEARALLKRAPDLEKPVKTD